MGIRSWYVAGKSINPTTLNVVNHAWNLVYLDGKCYYTDITWDDQSTDVFHAYYMISREECDTTHFPDYPEYLPESCGHTDLDYFEVHQGSGTGVGMLTGSYNAATIADCMVKINDDTWSCHVEDLTGGSAIDFLNWLKQNDKANAKAIATILGIDDAYRWNLSTLWDEYQLEFKDLPTYHVHNTYGIGKGYKAPTCTKEGNIAYFICTCGSWFEDAAAKSEIYDKRDVVIPMTDTATPNWFTTKLPIGRNVRIAVMKSRIHWNSIMIITKTVIVISVTQRLTCR